MIRRKLFLQYLSKISHIPFELKSIHTSCLNSKKPIEFLLSTEEALTVQLASILQSCVDPSALPQGRQVHALAIVNGFATDNHLGSKVLGMYVLCNSFKDAKAMFYQLDWFYALPWNWMIRGFTMMGQFEFALLSYFKMLCCGTSPDKYTFPHVIKACGGLNAVNLCKYVHRRIRLMGLEIDMFVASSLIKFYAENGHIDDARLLFDMMPQKDYILWNVMLNGYAKTRDLDNVMGVFKEIRNSEIKPNSVTFACILSVCAMEALIDLGVQLHGLVAKFGLEMETTVMNTLLAMYSKCRCLSDAHKLFEKTPQSDLVSWNGMISGYVQNGFMDEALRLFKKMINVGVKPDSVTFASFLPSVSVSASLKQGKEIHGYVIRHGVPLDVFLKSALIDIYFKCRDVKMAHKIFNQSTSVDIVICSSMISGYVLNGMNVDALVIFRWLLQDQIKPNSVTLASVLPACTNLAALKLGKELHCYILKNGLDRWCYVGSAVTDMYAKCGRLDLAHQLFRRMSEKDTVSWNAMITSCSQNGEPQVAIDLFRQMRMEGKRYDCVSISAALSASANIPALHYGKEIHGFMIRGAFNSDLFAESALIDMYAKCGHLDIARCVFDAMREKNEVSWNSIIAAYGNHGYLKDCLYLFLEMLKDGLQPDHVTFLAIISASGHAGQVDEGIHYFHCMTHEYGIMARMEHYACMVDLFGRAGRLDEALQVIDSMPFDPDAGVWGTLLGASRVHGNVELAELASKHLFTLDPQNSGYYVLLANAHADAGEWESVLKVRSLMKDRRVQKVPGYTWIEINNTHHMFVAADKSHPQSTQIYLLLKHLLLELKREGYAPQLYLPVHPQIMGSFNT